MYMHRSSYGDNKPAVGARLYGTTPDKDSKNKSWPSPDMASLLKTCDMSDSSDILLIQYTFLIKRFIITHKSLIIINYVLW